MDRIKNSQQRGIRRDNNINFPLFRFTRKEWADRFFKTGELRLGTLFDYAKNESYGDAIHDRHEGYYVYIKYDETPSGMPELRFTLARNNLLLCASTDYNEDFYEKFDADCCIVIESIDFYTEIDSALKSHCAPLVLCKVNYYDKSSWACIPEYETFAGVMKDIKFAEQKEVRALWEPQNYPMNVGGFEIPPGLVDPLNNSLMDFHEETWFQDKVQQEAVWLKPTTIFVPKAAKFCSLIER